MNVGIQDRNLGWKRRRQYLPTSQWRGTAPTQTQTIGPFYGLSLTATGTATEGYWKMPVDLDPAFPVGFRVNFTEGGATGTAVTQTTWTVLVSVIKQNVIGLATAAGALDTVLGTTNLPTTPKSLNLWSSRGIKNSLGINMDDLENGAMLQFSVNLSEAVGIAAGHTIVVYGIEIDYVPRAMASTFGNEIDRPLKADGSQ